jgi:putative inorganic carbon (hco3(-)) transporter
MEEPDRLVFAQQLCVVVAVTGAALVFAPNLLSTFLLPKMALVVIMATTAVLLAAARVWQRGTLEVRWNAATVAALVLAGAFCFATVTSPIPVMSLLGEETRRMGLVSYLSYIALFLVTVHAFRRDGVERLVRLLSLAALGVAGYGALQAVGMDPFAWDTSTGVVSTLANPNYVAAFLGAAAPLALWASLAVRDPFERILHGAAFVGALAVLPLTLSVQGAIVVAGALGVFAAGWLSLRSGRIRVVGLAALGGGAVVALVGTVAGLARVGPLSGVLGERPTFVLRTFHWRTALRMWREEPITGVGLDLFHAYARVHRPAELFEVQSGDRISASPFNLPLDMLASGGLILGVAYVAFVLVVGIFLVRGLVATTGGERLLLAAVGGAWLGFQLQSLVSIDVPPLAVLHYVLAGGIVALSPAPSPRTHRLPRGLLASRPASAAVLLAFAAVGVTSVAAAVVVLRADAAAGTAAVLEHQPQLAIEHADRAVRWASWEVRYREQRAELLTALGDGEAASADWRALLDLHPRWYTAHLGLARIAETAGDDERAAAHFERALELEPLRPAVRREIALFELRRDRPEAAASVMERAVEVMPSDAESWLTLGRAYVALDEAEAARDALERAVELGTGRTQAQAQRYLDGLG